MNNVQELPASAVSTAPAFTAADAGIESAPAVSTNLLVGRLIGDGISTFRPPAASQDVPYFGGGAGMGGLLTQLLSLLRELLGRLGSPNTPQYFQKATASSTGDPHLAFDATSASGQHRDSRFDSMASHPHLLQSDSFAGGYELSTRVTEPSANGVTFNQSATVTTNSGNALVSLDKSGNATIVSYGRTQTLSPDQTLDLGNGETVTRNADGSLVVRDSNGRGGYITTTLSENGSGVDASVSAENVDLSGYLVRGFGG